MAAILRTSILLGLVGSAVIGYALLMAETIPFYLEGIVSIISFPGTILIFILETFKVTVSSTANGILKSVSWLGLCITLGLIIDKN